MSPQLLVPYFEKETPSKSVQVFGDRLHASFDAPLAQTRINEIVVRAPQPIAGMRQIEPGIEDTFMELM
jgi:hypothetical protein